MSGLVHWDTDMWLACLTFLIICEGICESHVYNRVRMVWYTRRAETWKDGQSTHTHRERERERERDTHTHSHTTIHARSHTTTHARTHAHGRSHIAVIRALRPNIQVRAWIRLIKVFMEHFPRDSPIGLITNEWPVVMLDFPAPHIYTHTHTRARACARSPYIDLYIHLHIYIYIRTCIHPCTRALWDWLAVKQRYLFVNNTNKCVLTRSSYTLNIPVNRVNHITCLYQPDGHAQINIILFVYMNLSYIQLYCFRYVIIIIISSTM